MKVITENSAAKGKAGEEFVELYCADNKIPYKKTPKSQDYELGIDCIMNGEFTDVKNTKEIFFCQIMTQDGNLNTRHPFKANSKATHYCIVDVPSDDITKGKFIEHISIDKRLLRDFIKDENALISFKKMLKELNGKQMSEFGISQSQACFKVKQQLMSCCKSTANISYVEPSEANGEISFKLYITKPSTKPPTDVRSILDKYKISTKTITPIDSTEKIIIIEI